ncbi:MAG: heavy-metal-associated domain-containing protein [Rhodobacterales bacterium]|nr:heavy-metal-associated domain-containing protein [Rhodobacterales bacterium]
MTATYRVDGMTCGGCASSVTHAIQGAAPGTRVTVDLAAKTVTVEGNAEPAVVGQAVADAGFDFVGPAA